MNFSVAERINEVCKFSIDENETIDDNALNKVLKEIAYAYKYVFDKSQLKKIMKKIVSNVDNINNAKALIKKLQNQQNLKQPLYKHIQEVEEENERKSKHIEEQTIEAAKANADAKANLEPSAKPKKQGRFIVSEVSVSQSQGGGYRKTKNKKFKNKNTKNTKSKNKKSKNKNTKNKKFKTKNTRKKTKNYNF